MTELMHRGALWALVGLACSPRLEQAPPQSQESPAPSVSVPAPSAAPASPVSESAPESASDADLDAEIAWARREYGRQLDGIHFRSLVRQLRRWVSPGRELSVTVYLPAWGCKPARLVHPVPEPRQAEDGVLQLPTAPNPLYQHALSLLLDVTETVQKQKRTRSYGSGTAGHYFEKESGGGTDEWRDGKWVKVGGYGFGEAPQYLGTLSHVDDQIARYAGVPVQLSLECDGPHQAWNCPTGGSRRCDSCENVKLMKRESPPNLLPGGHRRLAPKVLLRCSPGPCPKPCTDPCPKLRPKGESRLAALLARTPLVWSDRPTHPTETASIYRDAKRCHQEHPTAQP